MMLFYLKILSIGKVFFLLEQKPDQSFYDFLTSRLTAIIPQIPDPEKVLLSNYYDSWQDLPV